MPSHGTLINNKSRRKTDDASAPTGSLSGLKFVQSVFRIVNDFHNTSPLVCGWSPDGLSFGVYCSGAELASRFEPGGYFRTTKYRSFVRQLNHYGFRKLREDEIPSGALPGAYYQHENFMRGRADLLKFITAKVNKGESEERSQLRQRVVTLERLMYNFLQVLTPEQRQHFQNLSAPSATDLLSRPTSTSKQELVVKAIIPQLPMPLSAQTTTSAIGNVGRSRQMNTNYTRGIFNDSPDVDTSDDDIVSALRREEEEGDDDEEECYEDDEVGSDRPYCDEEDYDFARLGHHLFRSSSLDDSLEISGPFGNNAMVLTESPVIPSQPSRLNLPGRIPSWGPDLQPSSITQRTFCI